MGWYHGSHTGYFTVLLMVATVTVVIPEHYTAVTMVATLGDV